MRLKYTHIVVVALLLCFYGTGCNIINPAEPTPTYVHIDSFTFTANPHNPHTGSNSHQITSVWAYYNNAPIGVFSLPATIPVLTNGTGTVSLVPGVSIDGLTAYQTKYTYYISDSSFSLIPHPGKIDTLKPNVRYTDSTHILWTEDFETGSSFVFNSGTDSMIRTIDPTKMFEGAASGLINLPTATDSCIEYSNPYTPFAIPNGLPYLELNYKSNTTFYIGMQAYTGTNTPIGNSLEWMVGVNPSATWKKIYISLESYIGKYTYGSFSVCIHASVDAGQSSGYVLLDNFKVLSY
jgi:hypothetical protein